MPFPSFTRGPSDSCTFPLTTCHTPAAPLVSPSVYGPRACPPHRHYPRYRPRHPHSHLHRYTYSSGPGPHPLPYVYWIPLCFKVLDTFLFSFYVDYRQLPQWTYRLVLFLGHLH